MISHAFETRQAAWEIGELDPSSPLNSFEGIYITIDERPTEGTCRIYTKVTALEALKIADAIIRAAYPTRNFPPILGESKTTEKKVDSERAAAALDASATGGSIPPSPVESDEEREFHDSLGGESELGGA